MRTLSFAGAVESLDKERVVCGPGLVGWWLLDRVWPFGCDQDGTPHCVSAIQHDIARGQQVVAYLTSDQVVNDYVAAHTTKLPYKGL